ncbi:MAG TPA: hypothetical protein DDW84_02305 [Phycisphaerales bacterium]|nr:hypothetical protein [Phycisphaerales bacterium]HBR20145.1 hypothetical protein [Phycisphaerales bacterium]
MSDKDVNIHVKADGVPQTKKDFEDISKSAQQLGQKTVEGNKQAADSTEKATQKMSFQQRILDGLVSQAKGLVVAWLGMKSVSLLWDTLNKKIERSLELSKEFYNKTVDVQRLGQRLELQTGTVGQQRQWGNKILALQKESGLTDPVAAQQAMLAADIAFSKQGGVKDEKILNLLMSVSSFFGAAQLTSDAVSKLFEFAGIAGVKPTEAAYKDYFAKILAGFTSSKTTDLGEYMIGLQKGATGYVAQGGSLAEAIATFSAARSVMANESLAATLLEQVTRLSGGGYEKPRKAIERGMHVKWDDLDVDERKAAMLSYVLTIPESKRSQRLAKEGFPVELTGQLSKIVSAEATQTLENTRRVVSDANSANLAPLLSAYKKSSPYRQTASKTKGVQNQIASVTPDEELWQDRLTMAEDEFSVLQKKGEDAFFIKDKLEPTLIAYDTMAKEARELSKSLPKGSQQQKQALQLLYNIETSRHIFTDPVGQLMPQTKKELYNRGVRFSGQLDSLAEPNSQQPIIINNKTDMSTHYHPSIEPNEVQRFTLDN